MNREKLWQKYKAESAKASRYLKAFASLHRKDSEYSKGIKRLMDKAHNMGYKDPDYTSVRAKLHKLFVVQNRLTAKENLTWERYLKIRKNNELRWKRLRAKD